jgi:hypothetical protein
MSLVWEGLTHRPLLVRVWRVTVVPYGKTK